MRRTTSRSSTRSGSRRASSSRSKRSKRAARPRLSARQVREIFGVLLMLAALLGLLAILSHAGSILGGIRDAMLSAFGASWFVTVAAAVALSAWLLWPKAPRPRAVDLISGAVAVLALVGLFGMAAQAGGWVGKGIDTALSGPFTEPGAWALLIAGLVIGLIVTIHFSPGALLMTAVGALRAANSERARLRDLVSAPAPEKPKAARPAMAGADVLTRSAASFATAPPAPDQKNVWDIDEPDDVVPAIPIPAAAVSPVPVPVAVVAGPHRHRLARRRPTGPVPWSRARWRSWRQIA